MSGANNKLKSLHLLNCELLESIQIGEYSFSYYAGDFKMMNLPQLQSIQLNQSALCGTDYSSCSLVMQSNNELI